MFLGHGDSAVRHQSSKGIIASASRVRKKLVCGSNTRVRQCRRAMGTHPIFNRLQDEQQQGIGGKCFPVTQQNQKAWPDRHAVGWGFNLQQNTVCWDVRPCVPVNHLSTLASRLSNNNGMPGRIGVNTLEMLVAIYGHRTLAHPLHLADQDQDPEHGVARFAAEIFSAVTHQVRTWRYNAQQVCHCTEPGPMSYACGTN